MKSPGWTYELRIKGTKPRDLPLDALAAVVKHLSDLLGSADQLRFKGLKQGSARLQVQVMAPAIDDVRVQVLKAKVDAEDGKPATIYKLNEYLGERGWSAELKNASGGIVISFPGTSKAAPSVEPRTVKQPDQIIGTVIKIGGRDETVPMTLKTDADTYVDVTVKGRELARELAHFLFGEEIRVSGVATWQCNEVGEWSCSGMQVTSYEHLDARPLDELFQSLRAIPGNGWHDFEDPIAELEKFRGND